MELSCLIPSTGSTYAYAYHGIGELPAMLAGFLLTLEYGISSAGGARSWSDKFSTWLESEFAMETPLWVKSSESVFDVYAAVLMALCVGIVVGGMQSGKMVVNVVTMTKISVIFVIICVGFLHFRMENVTPFIPKIERKNNGEFAYGWQGVLLGASASFYGYIGFDEVCCLAGEARHPTKNIPKAVLGTILGAAILSTLATVALVGMQPFQMIHVGESYGQAFMYVGNAWAAKLVATGEVLTMPITTLISFMAQPRVLFAMARDGLLPPIFAEMDENGNLTRGTWICGGVAIAIALCVPFQLLWNLISLGILVAFNLTNTSLVCLRADQLRSIRAKEKLKCMLCAYLLVSLITAYCWEGIITKAQEEGSTTFELYFAVFFSFVTISVILAMWIVSRGDTECGSSDNVQDEATAEMEGFQAPWVPLTPCVAIFFNWFLLCQMDTYSVLLITLWLSMALACYWLYGFHHSLAHQQFAYKMLEKPESLDRIQERTEKKEDITSKTDRIES